MVTGNTNECLFKEAMRVRNNATASTKVGCAVLDENGSIWGGCNVEHWFRTATLHAEVNAIGHMIAGGGARAVRCVIVADRDFFTPCGGCRDMLMQYGGPACEVFSFKPSGNIVYSGTVGLLCPEYPR